MTVQPSIVAAIVARPEWPLLIALAIGLLVGAERERRKGEGRGRSSEGLRTFALAGLLGGVTAAIGNDALMLLAGVFVVLAALTGYALGDREDPGLTGEFALVATFALGVLAHFHSALALELGVVMAALLAFRVQLHRLVREWVSEQELLDALVFVVSAVVILPLLPNASIDPFGLLDPFILWRLAVVVMAVSLAGYIAQRLVGARFGLLIAGLSGGLVSSTAAILAMGARSRAEPEIAPAAAAGAAASVVGSLGYLVAVIGAVSLDLLARLAAPIGLAGAAMLAYAALLSRGAAREAPRDLSKRRAFSGLAVLLFVALTAGFTFVSDGLTRWLGAAGAMVGAAVTGLADAHAAAASMASLHAASQLSPTTAALGVLLGLSTNMAVKIPAALLSGSRGYALRTSVGIALLLATLWIGWAVAGFWL